MQFTAPRTDVIDAQLVNLTRQANELTMRMKSIRMSRCGSTNYYRQLGKQLLETSNHIKELEAEKATLKTPVFLNH